MDCNKRDMMLEDMELFRSFIREVNMGYYSMTDDSFTLVMKPYSIEADVETRWHVPDERRQDSLRNPRAVELLGSGGMGNLFKVVGSDSAAWHYYNTSCGLLSEVPQGVSSFICIGLVS